MDPLGIGIYRNESDQYEQIASIVQSSPLSEILVADQSPKSSHDVQETGVAYTAPASTSTEVYDFDLSSVPGEGGTVMAFDDVDLYQKTVQSYEDAAVLAGPHRYGSEPALIFVQINEGLSSSDGQKVKGIVDSL